MIASMEKKKEGETQYNYVLLDPHFSFCRVFKGKSLRVKEGMSHCNNFSLN